MVNRVDLVHPQRVNHAMAIIASQYRQRSDAAHAPPPRGRQRPFFAAARATCVLALMLLTLPQVLTGCAHLSSPSLISLDGSPIDELSQVARVSLDSRHPLLLQGLDGHPLATTRFPNILAAEVFVLGGGRHTLWVSSVPYGHPLLPQRISCYQIDVALDRGAAYVLVEDRGQSQALVLRDDTGEPVASGRLVDRPWVFARTCRWE